MYLFLIIPFVCLLLNFAPNIVKLLHLSKLMAWRTETNTNELQQQLDQALAELDRVRQTPAASGEYAQFVKTMRAEQKVKSVEEKLRNEKTMGRLKGASTDLIAGYGLRALLSLVLFLITLRNRYTPVMIFDERFNFQPLEGLLSFPTGVRNAISVPVWVISCNVTFRLATNLLKKKM